MIARRLCLKSGLWVCLVLDCWMIEAWPCADHPPGLLTWMWQGSDVGPCTLSAWGSLRGMVTVMACVWFGVLGCAGFRITSVMTCVWFCFGFGFWAVLDFGLRQWWRVCGSVLVLGSGLCLISDYVSDDVCVVLFWFWVLGCAWFRITSVMACVWFGFGFGFWAALDLGLRQCRVRAAWPAVFIWGYSLWSKSFGDGGCCRWMSRIERILKCLNVDWILRHNVDSKRPRCLNWFQTNSAILRRSRASFSSNLKKTTKKQKQNQPKKKKKTKQKTTTPKQNKTNKPKKKKKKKKTPS